MDIDEIMANLEASASLFQEGSNSSSRAAEMEEEEEDFEDIDEELLEELLNKMGLQVQRG